ncbi:MAG: hypothetical protein E3J87_07520 [Candidatus Cloacimonadota bacterium]|nr:MAG: hypothetical protein E3J87_07520 [Candidatus Cloacimonadota bacterium]
MFSVLLFVLFSFSQQDSLDLYINKGLDASYIEDYDNARFYINKAIMLDPNNPLGYFVYAGLFRLFMSDFVTDSLLDSFFYYADKTIEKANLRIKNGDEEAWAHFYIGGINMYISSFYIEKGNYIKSFGFAERSINEIKFCLAQEPELYDAYLVMGSYEYLKGSFPLWSTYKNIGIEKVKKAALMSKYSQPMAKNVLAILLEREGRLDESLEIAKELVNTYPQGRTFRWTLSKVYMAREEWDETIENYEYLLLNIIQEQPGNNYNIIQTKLSLATAYYKKGEYDKVIQLCNDIFERGKNNEKTKKMVKETEKIYKKAKEGQ